MVNKATLTQVVEQYAVLYSVTMYLTVMVAMAFV